MKTLLAIVLFAVSTVAIADAKSDYVAAIQACVAANPGPPVTDARIACDLAAMDAYMAARFSLKPAKKAK
jgi:hypothetical protein